MSKRDTADKALMASVVGENVTEIAQDAAEIALDVVLDADGVLKEIPFVSWLVRARAIGHGIRDRLFLKKVALFLREASRVSPRGTQGFFRTFS